jgi:3-oxoacyl-[acyl-carrier protein] reductase
MDMGLKDRVAVVTGGGGGLGHATVRALAAEGCRVVAVDVADTVIGALEREDPGTFSAVIADVSTVDGPQKAIDGAVERFGRVDVLVTCAGVYGGGAGDLSDTGVRQLTADVWDRTIDINLRGTFLTAQAAIVDMAERGWGRVITISSVSAMLGGIQAGADYVASKAGVLGLTRSLAVMAGPLGITVNCISPGVVPTAMSRDNLTPELLATFGDRVPMRRVGTTEDIATAAVWLASENAGYMTGTHMDVNGGVHFS